MEYPSSPAAVPRPLLAPPSSPRSLVVVIALAVLFTFLLAGRLASASYTVSFGVEESCDGTIRLQTTEMGQDRILDRDRCSDTVCGESEHCELLEVQCFAAPCYPVPSCVAN